MWEVSTIAGKPNVRGFKDGNGEDALFDFPRGLSMNSRGNLILAESGNEKSIRELTKDGHVSTLIKGNPLQFPISVREDIRRNLFIADFDADVIRCLSPSGELSH